MWLVAVFVCLGWMISLCLHEFGHAIIAYWGGDTSVKDKGYLTLNPFKYTDPGLSLFMPLFFLLLGGFALPGGAVYIDSSKLKNRWWNSAVSAAGSVANILFVCGLAGIFHLIRQTDTGENLVLASLISSIAYVIFLNFYIVAINLLPIPGIDGYGIIQPWIPKPIDQKLSKVGRYGIWILIALLWFYRPFGRFLYSLANSGTSLLQIPDSLVDTGSTLFGLYARYLVLGLILILWLFRDKSKDVYRRGTQLVSARKYEEAVKTFDKAIKKEPNYYRAWLMRGYALYCLERFDDALISYDKALALKPDSADVWYYKGIIFKDISKIDAAFDCYNEVLKINPEYSEALTDRGQLFYHQQNYEQALADFNYSTKLNTDYTEAWRWKAYTLEQLQSNQEAIAAYQRVLQLQPRSEVWLNLAKLLEEAQLFEAIIALYDQKLKTQPEDPNIWNRRGSILQKLERDNEAKISFEQVITNCNRILKGKPDNADIWFQKGLALTHMHKYDDAITAYNQAVIIKPDFSNAWYNMACCYAQQNNLERAIQNLQQAIDFDSHCQEEAKTDSDFDSIREYSQFQTLLAKGL
jgi:tetratricopeptide (TPR) repeat protein